MNLIRARIEDAIADFLAIFEKLPGEVSLRELAQSLDNLTLVYFATPDVEPITDEPTNAPSIDEAYYASRAARLFPELQIYWTVDPEGKENQEIGAAFPESDLAEIANDLSQVIWEFKNGSEADAIWEFRFGYQHHWGDHLHDLRHYIHRRGAW